MSLKALADKVLQRDSFGTATKSDSYKLSHRQDIAGQHSGTVTLFPISPEILERWEERAAIMEFDGGLSKGQAEILAFYEYQDLQD